MMQSESLATYQNPSMETTGATANSRPLQPALAPYILYMLSLREHLRRWLLGALGYLSSSLPSWWQLQQDPRPTEMQRRAK